MVQVADRHTRHLRAQTLVSRAYALPASEREQLIEQETAADPALRNEVRWLLEALATPAEGTPAAPPAEAPKSGYGAINVPAPRNYTLIRPLGEGGMGTVYLAERVEGNLRQVVALKLLNFAAALSPLVVSRFLTERQLLAKLTHPHIARLIDAGALADGRPFLAMEFVEGTELGEYCATRQLDLPDRLKLFLKICAAVQYAHRHLVIHRDLKPANVMVTPAGEPKLVDFGIARSWSGADDLATRTVEAARIMTIAYASPEQLAGQPLSTATDVYSLGIMLYELVAGRRPWGDSTDPLALARVIERSEPLPPSVMYRTTLAGESGERPAVPSAPRWRRWLQRFAPPLPRDLDAIVLKALRVKPEDRYASVQALADDLVRLQNHQPVRARQGHTLYRLARFIRRHLILLSVALGIVVLTAGYIVDRQRQLDVTDRERANVVQIRDFLLGLFREVQPAQAQGKNISAREMLDLGAKRLEAQTHGDRITRVKLLATLAETYLALGENKVAARIGDQAVSEAHAIPDVPPEVLAEALGSAALAHTQLVDSRALEAGAREVLALAKTHPQLSAVHQANALSNLAMAQIMAGKSLQETGPHLRQAVALLQREAPNSTALPVTAANFGATLLRGGEYAEGMTVLGAALSDAQRILGPNHPTTLYNMAIYGEALHLAEFVARGEQVLQQALQEQTRVLGPGHPDVGLTRSRLASVYFIEEKWHAAERLTRQQLALVRSTQKHESMGTVLGILFLVHASGQVGHTDEAEQLLQEANALLEKILSGAARTHWQGMASMYHAEVLLAAGKPAEAQARARQALQTLATGAAGARFRHRSLLVLGDIAQRGGDFTAAEQLLREALTLSPGRAYAAHIKLASVLRQRGDFSRAEAALAPVYQSMRDKVSPDAPVLARARDELRILYQQSGQPHKAALLGSG